MLFRNLVLYRLPAGWSIGASDLEEALAQRPLRPCGSFDMQTRGWIPCDEGGRLVHAQGSQYLVTLGVEQKLLPASVIRQEARERAAALAEAQGHPVGRRQMREIKARVADELRARALARRRATGAWLNLAQGWLAVDAAGASRAEQVVDALRDALGSFAAAPLQAREPAGARMAAWLAEGRAPGHFAIEQDLELKAADGSGATVRYSRHPLDGTEIRAHLGAGKFPTRLGLSWNGRVAFLLQPDLHLRRLQFLDLVRDDQAGGEDPREQLDIDFALMSGELGQLVAELVEALGGAAVAEVRQAA